MKNALSEVPRSFQILTIIIAVVAVGALGLAIRGVVVERELYPVVIAGVNVSCYQRAATASELAEMEKTHVVPMGGRVTICVQASGRK
jgi:hypothetical protein